MVSHLTTPPASEPGDEAPQNWRQRQKGYVDEVNAGQIPGMGNVLRDAPVLLEQQKRYANASLNLQPAPILEQALAEKRLNAAMTEAAADIAGGAADAAGLHPAFDVEKAEREGDRGSKLGEPIEEYAKRIARMDAPVGYIGEVTEADYNRRKREYAGQSSTFPQPSFLSQRRDLLTRDIAKMCALKQQHQAEIVRLRRLVFELTQSVRSNEDALDRLAENEG